MTYKIIFFYSERYTVIKNENTWKNIYSVEIRQLISLLCKATFQNDKKGTSDISVKWAKEQVTHRRESPNSKQMDAKMLT